MSDKNYVLIPLPDGTESMTRVMLKGGAYEGIVYQYGKVDFDPRAENLKIFFEYEVFVNPSKIDTESKAFRDVIFEILVELIEKACS